MTAQRRLADNELLIVRTFNASPSVVFALWSSVEHMKRWMGPNNFTCPEARIDFRVGGTYRAMIKTAENGSVAITARSCRISVSSSPSPGITKPSAGLETLVTITFEEREGKTVQTFHQAPFSNNERCDNHVNGWSEAFDKLHAYVAEVGKELTA